MQGRRTFLLLDEWLTKYVGSAFLRFVLMASLLILTHVVIIAAVVGLVDLVTWLLQGN
jgi:hypothetical protein